MMQIARLNVRSDAVLKNSNANELIANCVHQANDAAGGDNLETVIQFRFRCTRFFWDLGVLPRETVEELRVDCPKIAFADEPAQAMRQL